MSRYGVLMMFDNLPSIPNMHALFVLVLTLGALHLFRRDDVSLETSSLGVIAVLTVAFSLAPFEQNGKTLEPASFFHGLGHEALITVCGLMILGHAIVISGALEPIGRHLARLWRGNPSISFAVTLVVAGTLSAFINNTPVVVLLLPILVSVAIKTHSDASRLLLPMGLATLVGGMVTTIGTSTNLLVVSVAEDMGMERFSMFDFAPIGLLGSVVALIYLWLVAPLLLPQRTAALRDVSPRLFSAYLRIGPESPVVGEKLSAVIKMTDGEMRVISMQRGNDKLKLMPLPDTIIKAGDRLRVKDYPSKLKEFEAILKATLHSGEHCEGEQHSFEDVDQMLAEIVVISGSGLIDRTLKNSNFATEYGITAIALHREGKEVDIGMRSIASVNLKISDILLVQGDTQQIEELKSRQGILVLDGVSKVIQTSKAPITLSVLLAVVLLPIFNILPIVISSICGVLVLLATRCMSWLDVGAALSTKVIMSVAASLALGSAMLETGGAHYLAQVIVALSSGLPVGAVLASLMLLLAILTNIVSNNAAAVIGTPIAISVAQQLGVSPEPFVLAVLFGANLSYATPMAYKTNLLVMNAGRYQFSDFVRVGVPLIILMWVVLSLALNWLYLM